MKVSPGFLVCWNGLCLGTDEGWHLHQKSFAGLYDGREVHRVRFWPDARDPHPCHVGYLHQIQGFARYFSLSQIWFSSLVHVRLWEEILIVVFFLSDDVPPGKDVCVCMPFTPYLPGRKKLMVVYESNELKCAKGEATLVINSRLVNILHLINEYFWEEHVSQTGGVSCWLVTWL